MGMLKYLARRLAYCLLVLVGVSIIAFLIPRLSPGDPAILMLPEGATQEDVAIMRKKMGLDRPLWEQYLTYMSGLLRGDLGNSLFYRGPSGPIIWERLKATGVLVVAAVIMAVILSIPLGIVAAVKQGSAMDVVAMSMAILGQSASPVWVGILLIYVLAVQLQVLPPFGYGSFSHLVMPAITLGMQLIALSTRLTRSGMLETLQEDYILAAKAQGLPRLKILGVYALRNVMIPVVTVLGVQIGGLLSGSLVTEAIYGWPGIGRLSITALMSRDYPMIQAIILVTSSLFVLINVAVDVLYSIIDPRIRLG